LKTCSLGFAAALLGCAPFLAQAQAQSPAPAAAPVGVKTLISGTDLTIYGVFDLYAARYSTKVNGQTESTNEIGSGGTGGSRLGFYSTRAISPDVTVGGRLEAGINVDSGRIGSSASVMDSTARTDRVWSRQAYLSIASKKAGELRIGRQQGPSYQFMTQYDPILMPTVDGWGVLTTLGSQTPGVTSGFYINPTIRTENTLYYESPSLSGLVVRAAYSGRDSRSTDRAIKEIWANYANGPLSVGVMALHASGTISSRSVKEQAFAASYDLRVVKPYLTYVQRDVANPSNSGGDLGKQKTVLLGAIVPVSSAGAIRTSLGRYSRDGVNRDATNFAIAYTHDVAPGFMLYGGLSFLKQDSLSRIPIFTSAVPDAGASVNAITVGASYRF
jgi:predicted porin